MIAPGSAADLARRLARCAEAVCRTYLSNGRRAGGYWIVGDYANTPGASLFVRLHGPEAGKGAAGKWTDAATGEHGDLLDLIARNRGLHRLHDVLDEARAFLSLPQSDPRRTPPRLRAPASRGSSQSAQRLFAMAQALPGSLAEAYLRARGLNRLAGLLALKFHPRCFYRASDRDAPEEWPALLAAVTDLQGAITGVHRTWLDLSGGGKAPIETPRRAMGHLLGHAVRFGAPQDVLAAGEGIETVLSVREVLPTLPLVAALSANHLTALLFPEPLRFLYILRDADAAGDAAVINLTARAEAAGIEARALSPKLGDFNDDLRQLGRSGLWANLVLQLDPAHRTRFVAASCPVEIE